MLCIQTGIQHNTGIYNLINVIGDSEILKVFGTRNNALIRLQTVCIQVS